MASKQFISQNLRYFVFGSPIQPNEDCRLLKQMVQNYLIYNREALQHIFECMQSRLSKLSDADSKQLRNDLLRKLADAQFAQSVTWGGGGICMPCCLADFIERELYYVEPPRTKLVKTVYIFSQDYLHEQLFVWIFANQVVSRGNLPGTADMAPREFFTKGTDNLFGVGISVES